MKGFIMFFVMALLLISYEAFSQSKLNLTGKWELQKSLSSKGMVETDYDGTLIMNVKHSKTSFSYSHIYRKAGNKDFETESESFNLDGKIQSEKFSMGVIRKQGKAMNDTIVIIYEDVRKEKAVESIFQISDTLILDKNGNLQIKRFSSNPIKGKSNAILVFKKVK